MDAKANDKRKPSNRRRQLRVLDEIDYRILDILQKYGDMTDKEISTALDSGELLQAAACGKRVKYLKEQGYIKGHTFILNPELLYAEYLCFMHVKIPDKTKDADFREIIIDDHRVMETHSVFGDIDYILKVRVRDKKEAISLSRELSNHGFPATTIETVETIKETTEIRLPMTISP